MNRYLIFLMAACVSQPAFAQRPNSHDHPDHLVSRWVIDANLLGGFSSQSFTTANSSANYPNGLNMNTGKLTYNNGYSYGGDAQLGFFFGKMRHFGIGAGFMYLAQQGNAELDNYQAEYQATDSKGNIYRQVVTGSSIKETVKSSNVNIPLVLKYKTRFSKHWGFSADAGALFNLQMKNAYTTDASFNYEAIYKFVPGGDAGTVSVYDNSPVASMSDWFVTKKQFFKNNPSGNYQDYLAAERAAGINVGEGIKPGTRTGNTSYTAGAIGFMVQPSVNYYLSDYVAINLGAYYMIQPFKNTAQGNYRLESGMGSYSSVLNNVTASTNQTYGVNVGARFFFRKKERGDLTITSIDQSSPTQCGFCDGSIVLHGLSANEPVTVDYSLNGAQQSSYATTVQTDGQVKIANLCAGNYSGITLTIKKRNATGKPVTLSDPSLRISSQNTTNPTLAGGNNGSVKFNGLSAGSNVSISYMVNGNSQTYTGVVNSDNSITIGGLYEGTYTGIVVTTNSCKTTGSDFILKVPQPTVVLDTHNPSDKTEVSPKVLFDFDKSVINTAYYPELDNAIKEIKDNEYISITVDGYTDKVGTEEYNQKLSERRAAAIKTYFIQKGISAERIEIYGHGEDHPDATNNTANGRMLNRRIIIMATKK